MFIYQKFYTPYINQSLQLLFCGTETCRPGHTFGPAKRTRYLFHLVTHGTGTFRVNQKTTTLRAGMGFVIIPGDRVTYMADVDNPWTYQWICFDGPMAETLLGQCGFNHKHHLYQPEDPSPCIDAMNRLLNCSQNQEEHYLQQMSNLYHWFSIMSKPYTPDLQSSSSYVQQALTFIHDNYAYDLKITDIADAVGLERSYMYRIFMAKTGQSLKSYLIQYQLKKARLMLMQPEANITEVAYTCGFRSSSTFYKQFKKQYNTTPKAFHDAIL